MIDEKKSIWMVFIHSMIVRNRPGHFYCPGLVFDLHSVFPIFFFLICHIPVGGTTYNIPMQVE